MPLNRQETLSRLVDDALDVLVVGGGIVGAGVAREAALRGLKVGLVEQQDFAAGTSSRSSRLLHGGLRYLAQGRIKLVRESSREKEILARIAPHLCEPLPFLFPTRTGSGWPKWKLRLGVKLYGWLARGANLGSSSALSRDETLACLPLLQPEQLTGAVRYFDALTSDARLVLDTLRSAAAYDALLANYARLAAAHRDNDIWVCQIEDAAGGASLAVRARAVVNATGPWADRLPHSGVQIRPTKGVHLVIERARLDVPDAVVMADGPRILFAIPWGQRVILGTTDTDYDGPLESPRCSEADIETVLRVVNDTFPQAGIGTDDIKSTWAGLRPLVADKRGRPSDISRRHEILSTEPGWWDVTGGKLTTYRLMAEQTIEQVARGLGKLLTPSRSATEPLVADAEPAVIPPEPTAERIAHYCRDEWALHVDDILYRRAGWRHSHDDHLTLAERVIGEMASSLGWDDARRLAERDRYQCMLDAER